jgi:protein-S-isoprenylcysteine O-methyltransferase Ste14
MLCVAVARLGPYEERALEARFGDDYREYARHVLR